MTAGVEHAKWTQVIVADREFLSGSSLLRLLDVIDHVYPIRHIAARKLEGANLGSLEQAWDPRLYGMTEFRALCAEVTQFDWGDFQCFQEIPRDVAVDPNTTYAELIRLADVTVRAVDDSSFYIYTRMATVATALQRVYPGAEVREGVPEEFEFPE